MSANTEDSRIAIIDAPFDCDESKQPFGKRWRQESLALTEEHLAALARGQWLAIDVQGEYVVYLKREEAETQPLLLLEEASKGLDDMAAGRLKDARPALQALKRRRGK